MSEPITPNSTLSHYRIVSKIGAGGMGEVYLAQDIELERQVALKVLLADVANDEDRVHRFVREAKAASALNHPNILTVYEIGTFEKSRFIATELIKGQSLHEQLRGEPISLGEAIDVAMQIAAALSAAHGAGIVHRDIKPDNIMLRDDGLVKVLDFGLAKLTPVKELSETDEEAQTRMRRQTRPGVVMGTVSYMSPEQARGKAIDARSDIWSLGVVLYEMLTGRTPFAGETMNDSIAAILTRDPDPLESSTPSELQRIVRKALQKKTDERYQTVRDFQLDLKNLKRELEFSEELERSQIPQSTRSSHVSTSQVVSDASTAQPATVSTQASLPPPQRSSAEYLVSEIKNHKRSALAVMAILVVGLIGGGYWFWNNRVTASTEINSIAVIPFENRSATSESEYLADGLAESLIYRLSQLPNLKVSPTSSVFRYKGKEIDPQKIAAELGVGSVMTGRITQRGENLTISVELVDVRNNKLLWGEQYDRKMSDLLATQREIATTIAERLQPKLSGTDTKGITKRYTDNNEAYQLYMKGRFYWNRRTADNLRKAVEQLTLATEKDPNFALAYAAIADCYVVMPTYTGQRASEIMPQARALAKKAIELDSTLAEPHASLGGVNWFLDWDAKAAENEYKQAIQLNPNYPTAHHWYSRVLRAMGRQDEALKEIKRAEELDPLSLVIINNVAENYLDLGDYEAAAKVSQRMLELDPNFWNAHLMQGLVLVKQGHLNEALPEIQNSVELAKRSNSSIAILGYVYGRLGRRSEAEAIIKELEGKFANKLADGRDLAVVYAGLDDKDQVFAWLEKAFAYHSFHLAGLNLEPLLTPLRDDPRWKDLQRRIGVAER